MSVNRECGLLYGVPITSSEVYYLYKNYPDVFKKYTIFGLKNFYFGEIFKTIKEGEAMEYEHPSVKLSVEVFKAFKSIFNLDDFPNIQFKTYFYFKVD